MSVPDSLLSKHFLVVDDYESMREMVSDELKNLGITKISFATSGNEALKKIVELEATDPVQYILTDMMMPDGSGIDLVIGIRQKLNNKLLPILMITSISDVSSVLEAVKAGVSNYIVKPWEEEEFLEKLISSDKSLS